MSRTGRALPLTREKAAWSGGALLIGVDEVGRGPRAGPVVAAAVVFPPGTRPLAGVRDSKTLSARQRADLVPAIHSRALAWAVAAASVREIDRFNIRRATALAMRRAVSRIVDATALRSRAAALGAPEFRILLDGLPMPECRFPHDALVDGDARCYSIAAAGIIAKEIRDDLMRRLARRHPDYGWDSNAGYGTAYHCEALAARGPTRHHRQSFFPVAQCELGL
jgi:ribonuclease HII